jgi:hypothetical protein
MSTALQPELPLHAARLKRPCVDSNGARAILDKEDWQMEAILDLGAVRGVVNIARKDSARKELRFVVVCLEEYKAAQRTGAKPLERTPAELTELIFGKPRPYVRVQAVYRAFNSSHYHFYRMAADYRRCRDKDFELSQQTTRRGGPGGSAVVEWSALVKFIEKRRIA